MQSPRPDPLPRLRPVDAKWLGQDGAPMLALQDPLGLHPDTLALRHPFQLIAALCDGKHTVERVAAELGEAIGIPIEAELIAHVVRQLDEHYLLDNARARLRRAEALREYRAGGSRPLSHADAVYPSDPAVLRMLLDGFGFSADGQQQPAGRLTFVLSPHIDYRRGGDLYAATWSAAAAAARSADLAVVLGTDHYGGPAMLTLTRVPYATPLGPLPLPAEAVERLAAALGEDAAFAEELHHRREHSIELAGVWLHHARGGQPLPLLPVLCGSFHPFTSGDQRPEDHPRLSRFLDALAEITAGKRVLVVAAADLAHVGPTFNDAEALDDDARSRLARADECLLAPVLAGDAAAFLEELVAERDARKVCGLPPTYLALRLLQLAEGGPLAARQCGYKQAPADADGGYGSVVSIAGVVLAAG